jgi:hypothetical protein
MLGSVRGAKVRTGATMVGQFILILRDGHRDEVDRNTTLVRLMQDTVNKRSRPFILKSFTNGFELNF